MTGTSASPPSRAPLAALPARRPQFEVIPLPGVLDDVLAHLPPPVRVSVTSSPSQGQEATLALAEHLAAAGCTAIPHLAARRIRDAAEAREIAARLRAASITEALVIAGDPSTPAGELADALALMEALHGEAPQLVLGTVGYPEGHPYLDPLEEVALLRRKAEHASWVATQMCFTAGPVLAWARRLRTAGVDLPVRPGVPGPVGIGRLLRIGARVGVGPSLRMLHRHGTGMRHLTGTWAPDALLAELYRSGTTGGEGLAGPHVYTFNVLETASRLRDQEDRRAADRG